MKKSFVLFFFFTYIFSAHARSLVFNMRVRRTFANLDNILKKEDQALWLLNTVPIGSYRQRHLENAPFNVDLNEKTNIGGTLINLRLRANDNWWGEVTTGFEHEKACFKGTANFCAARTGFDDVVLSGGYNKYFSQKVQGVLYGLAGFPTRRKVTQFEADNTLVGTRFYSAGIGSELSYSFMQSLEKSLFVVFQNRFLHFFSRKWQPIFEKIVPGNVTDFLFSARYRQRANLFESGYNPTVFSNQAVVRQGITINARPFVRHNIYTTYAHLFQKLPMAGLPGALGAGVSAGFSDRFNIRVVTYWAYMTIVF